MEMITVVETKSLEATVSNYRDGISKAPARYKAGVEKNNNQNENAIAAQGLYEARIAESIANKARVRGLQGSSTAAWKQAASTKGASRIGPGMTAALPKFSKGIGDVLATIQATTIAERTADPMANIDNRVKPIAQALYDMKRK